MIVSAVPVADYANSRNASLKSRKISCSRLLSQALDSTTLPKNTRIPMGESKIFLKYYINSISCTIIPYATDFSRLTTLTSGFIIELQFFK